MSVTLKEIAQMAGVSVGTASAALNNRPTVSPETRARVIDVAVSLGYARQDQIEAEVRRDLKVVGLLIKHDLGARWEEANPFYSRIQLGVQRACESSHISLMVGTIEVDASNRPISMPNMLNGQHVDGLILAGAFIDDAVTTIQRRIDVPVVLVDGYAKNWRCDSIVTDNIGGARQAVQYLVTRGHRHIAPPSIHERRQGYLDILQEYALESYIVETELSREDGEAGAAELFARAPHITAFFGCNDDTALGVLAAARKTGRTVPGDLSLVGFDNIDLSKEITPALTTIHVHKSWMGAMSVQALIDRVRHPKRPKVTTVVSTDLIVRDSVRPVDEV
jgi:LacI family transcriptional regulator